MPGADPQLSLFDEAENPDMMSGFSVRESARAKRLSIKVYPRGRVEVVVPRRTRAKEVRAFVESHGDWIAKTRASFALEHPPEPFALPQTIRLDGVDRTYSVRYRRCPGEATVSHRASGRCIVLSGQIDDDALCVAALKRWLAATAKRELLPRLRALAALTGNDFKRLQVRGQRTCWGSHSSSGTISLNYCLLFLPPEHLRYVLVHELCHARHMNHSKRFWALVGRYEPDYRRLDRALNEDWKRIPVWVGIY